MYIKYNSLLVFWEFHIIHPNPTQLPVFPYLPLIPVASLPKRNTPQTNSKQNTSFLHLSCFSNISPLVLAALELRCVTHSVFNQPHPQISMAMSPRFGSRPLHRHPWTLTEAPLGYPTIALCHGRAILQDHPLHTLQRVIDGVDLGETNPRPRVCV